ncbi:HlyD family efflux transporter periplasmic adaptor subunit [Corallococcus praedator]|uniref:HlyD family efflux transporter periplasmic adaptor subunit n=1 Tax=Corallococcus praedator TaxID=2316724 RepID=A0ABX9Q5X1_9BACT|nr:HlyD family efflux transporter periplasmic adaptor subunit [Corallococcus sp. CA047B]RKH91407.1 HlyD family efflux transporter periplasmic adaptor subunit [Corallococcus praedator]
MPGALGPPRDARGRGRSASLGRRWPRRETRMPGQGSAPKRSKRAVVAAVVLVAVIGGGLAWLRRPASGEPPPRFTGYVVSDNVYLSSPVAGIVASVGVVRGQRVEVGTPLFRMEPTSLVARADQARAQVAQTEAQLLARRSDMDRARASLASARAEVERADADLSRFLAVQKAMDGAVTPQQLDLLRATVARAHALRDVAVTDVSAAGAQWEAVRAQLTSGRAGLTAAERQVSELAPVSPVAGFVEDVLFHEGEWAAPNAAVISIVPDARVKVRFYVPQARVASYAPGTGVAIACDGCDTGMTARVDYVAPRPEYTPPIIYSLESRQKLVFLVEAVPAAPTRLLPGQPIDVTPLAMATVREAR